MGSGLSDIGDYVLTGVKSGSAEWGSVGSVFGAKTVTLTSAQMPSHTHVQDAHSHTGGDYGHTHPVWGWNGGDGNGVDWATNGERRDPTVGTGYANVYINSTTATNQSTGGGGSHSVAQPSRAALLVIKT